MERECPELADHVQNGCHEKGALRWTQSAGQYSTETILERVYVPQDAHSWGKELTGRLCYDGTTYTYNCWRNSDCESGETCVDKSLNLIGIAAADAPNDCSFYSSVGTDNQARFQ